LKRKRKKRMMMTKMAPKVKVAQKEKKVKKLNTAKRIMAMS